jgi:hypothetical protein
MKIEDILDHEYDFECIGDRLTFREALKLFFCDLLDGNEYVLESNGRTTIGRWDIYEALVNICAIPGDIDEDGFVEWFNEHDAEVLLKKMVMEL